MDGACTSSCSISTCQERTAFSRFAYLFEPLDDEEPVDAALDAESPASNWHKSAPSAAPVRMAFAALVLGTLAVVAVISVLLMQRPDGAIDPVQLPLAPRTSTPYKARCRITSGASTGRGSDRTPSDPAAAIAVALRHRTVAVSCTAAKRNRSIGHDSCRPGGRADDDEGASPGRVG